MNDIDLSSQNKVY